MFETLLEAPATTHSSSPLNGSISNEHQKNAENMV